MASHVMDLQLLPLLETEISHFTDIWLAANSGNHFQEAAYGNVGPDVIKPVRTKISIKHVKL